MYPGLEWNKRLVQQGECCVSFSFKYELVQGGTKLDFRIAMTLKIWSFI